MSSQEELISQAQQTYERVRSEQEQLRARERELKAERAASLQEALDGGVTATRLAEEIGINRVTLYKLLKEHRPR
ncbi:hypothetical protein [Nesterenkonia sp. PF2B19]|uniref:hypothetical protein n=1 Tax=Nesterenkonia sp. PF2B19 TaxID=1881858 RepID=UPI0008731444|nr:hypothetical protein [Nesterenkonia sp. PF2B19]OSM43447.1 hypothetical protein BCY76_007985 [Nesterenkonia sp. PF2B19]